MKKKIVGIAICLLLISSTTALALTPFRKNEQQMKQQLSDTTPVPLTQPKGWIKTFGEFGEDIGYSVRQTFDGGYIIAGSTNNIGYGGDVWLIKTDKDGNMLWDKIFGGNDRDEAYSVQQTSDDGYIIAGMTFSFGSVWVDAWLIKTDENGDEQWNKTYGGTHVDMAKSVQQTFDGGYIIAGSTESDFWLIKTDGNGNIVWDTTYGGNDFDEACSVQQTSDNGYIIAGTTKSFGAGDKDFWLIKTDGNGNIVWDTTYGGKDIDEAYSAQQTSDNGYIIAGMTLSFGAGIINAWLVKTDADGNKIWDRTFGRKFGNFAHSVQQTSDNGYIIAGSTGGYGDVNGDVWLIKTDSQGKSKTTSSDNLWFERLFHRFLERFPILERFLTLLIK